GTDAINVPLSQRRAGAVTQYLAGQGVAADRLMAQGRGAANPVGDNGTAQGRALNRRVELFLYAVKYARAASGRPGGAPDFIRGEPASRARCLMPSGRPPRPG